MPRQPQNLLSSTGHPADASCTRVALAQEALQRFGQLRFRALGSSMLPAIAPGDLLVFRTAAAAELAPGQVVLVRRDAALVAHRLVSCNGDNLITMGDSLSVADTPVHASQLLGVLDAQLRGARALPRPGGHHRRLLPRTTRWLLRHAPLARRIACRWPRLTAIAA
ncbi:S24/S26 family peptidase [Thermomonas sp.]|uniref:S24/S26 family peptidase n=1 Tax=Thermomonas sp. TaxID=1971895 RepID=UPI003784EF89